MASPLETLPLLVLERICEYLDDDSEKRRSLWAFSLTSRGCCAAAAVQRFCQIQLKISALDELESGLRRWTEVLEPDGRHRHVRRLKVLREERRNRGLQAQDDEAEDDNDEHRDDWDIRHYFDMHDFCRPSKVSMERVEQGSMPDHPEAWLPLARFIGQLPALKDLVWACGPHMPRSVLSAVHVGDCRLHMHCFRLRSLIQPRDSPQPIDPDDYALATSPSLSSIVVGIRNFETDGYLNYNKEAVMRMVAGMAPSLAHVWLIPTRAGDGLVHREAIRLGKPAWGGFFPGSAGADKLPVLGSLQSLVLPSYIINNWSCYTDFAKLRRLTISWISQPSVVLGLAEMAMRGDFESLDTLGLPAIEDETNQVQEALNRLLENLNPLQRLDLSGSISDETFNIVLRRHGRTLRNLSVHPYRDRESRYPLVAFSEAVVRRLVEQCPNLEQVWLPVDRTRGDDRETGIYRALSRLPRLRHAFLRLCFSVGPDEDYWDAETDGEYPLSSNLYDGEEIPFIYLREAFSNSAIDATLALSIFNLISSGGSLRYLTLEMIRKEGPNAPASGCYGPFQRILRWFNRSWVCKQDTRGGVTVQELDRKWTAEVGEEWQYLSEGSLRDGEEIYQEVFNDIWPQKTPEWWKDWKSLPLSNGVA